MRHYLSIPTRIFLAFTFVLLLFASVAGLSLVQHQRTASTLRLLHAGYLPLALSVGEARAAQAVFATLLDRLLDDGESVATRNWLGVALRVRPLRLRRAIEGVSRVARLNPPPSDQDLLRRVHAGLVAVREIQNNNEPRFKTLFDALRARDRSSATRLLTELRAEERKGQRQLRQAWATLQQHMASTSMQADKDEQQMVIVLGVLSLVVLFIGSILMWWSNRLLAPLPLLQERVEAVSRGELKRYPNPKPHNELGSLAVNFEHMVETLAARDESLRETTNRLVQSEQLAAIGQLAAQVTHEVRNPLSSIGLNVELLEEDLSESSQETKDLLTSIRREIDRLTEITEKYLSLKRLPSPQRELDDFDRMLHSIIEFIRPEFQKSQITLSLQSEGVSHLLYFDEDQIRQALLNLLRNCKEAMPDGGKLELVEHWNEDGLSLSIVDQGIGMDDETRSKIFNPFFTTKERGTGLGLSLTQQIVVAHGGSIECKSSVGQGSTFILHFPHKSASPTSTPPSSTTQERTA
ncbi:MAG: HAMP domain-containing protein [Myxococcales bacterium]|nr:MAG: HAMP domain-containing protein [Myxococcales bacterium]